MYSSLKETEVITDDAYLVGNIHDVNYSSRSWDVHSLFVRGVKGLGDVLGASAFRKLQFSLVVDDYALNDVLLIPETRDQLQRALASDENDTEKIGSLIGKTVMSLDEIPIGTIEDVGIDTDAWKINSFKVKMEKNVATALDIKLGLLNKTASGLLTNHVESVTKTVNLAHKVEELRGYFTLD
jgi:sporulation protein YlmC with PRC-barrel domain